MRKEYHKYFRFIKKNGRFYVIFKDDPGRPKSTGIHLEDGEEKAVSWAYEEYYRKPEEEEPEPTVIKFGDVARNFYDTEKCTWTKRMFRKGRTFSSSYFDLARGRLKNYILPQWENVPLDEITTKGVDEWLMDLNSVQNGIPLAPASLDKILVSMRRILAEAEYQGYVTFGGLNPAERVGFFDTGEGEGRLPFTIEEIHKLFPPILNDALNIWLTLEWYAYFLMQWTCGMRPGEVSGFMLRDWLREHDGAVISRSIDNNTRALVDLKTAKRGVTVKPVLFSDKLVELLKMLEFRGAPKDNLLFKVDGKPILLETANKHFKASVIRADLDLKGRTQYCLRHTFYTETLKHLPEAEVTKMAGHKALRKEYDHRESVDFIKASQPIREVINELSA